jgi:hypothetical protein
MLKRSAFYSILCLCSLLLTAKANAQTVSYQGLLAKADGMPAADGRHAITVSFYTAGEGGTQLWSDTFETETKGGVFSLALGSAKPLPAPSAMDKPLWLSIAFDGSRELTRTQLSAVPMAMSVADNSITAQKLATDYVSSISVNGQPVTGRGTSLNIVGDVMYDDVAKSLILTAPTTGTNAKGAQSQSVGDKWLLGGNTGIVTPQDEYLGTQGSDALWIRVNGGTTASTTTGTVMRYIPSTNPRIIGGDAANTVSADGSVIAGGGTSTNPNSISGGFGFLGSGRGNSITTWYDVVGGGQFNASSGGGAVIAGGEHNIMQGGNGSIGGGDSNTVTYYYGAIAGGQGNLNNGLAGALAGGRHNDIESDYGVIGGGRYNKAGENPAEDDIYVTVGGGYKNWAEEEYSTIAGGDSSFAGSRYGFIGGGEGNLIEDEDTWASHWAVIAGGLSNEIHERYGFIGSGLANRIGRNAEHAVIAGGRGNVIEDPADLETPDSALIYSAILGGHINTISGSLSSIGGGDSNQIAAGTTRSFIGGGYDNYIGGNSDVIAGGDTNVIDNPFDVDNPTDFNAILGGANNKIVNYPGPPTRYSVIVGGHYNRTQEEGTFIGGGDSNLAAEDYASVVGGQFNQALGPYDIIGGGQGNLTQSAYELSHNTIGGGFHNRIGLTFIYGYYNGIGSGERNRIEGHWSTIAGGDTNFIGTSSTTTDHAFIGGGAWHSIQSPYSTIGGGRFNFITSAADYATIPGGDSLKAQSFAQVVLGYNNIPKGSFTQGTHHAFAVSGPQDDPLLILGNGDKGASQSNAFEVSYDGHTTVFDGNGNTNTGGRPPIFGSTYYDNIIYAWGDIPKGTVGLPVTPTADFGISNVTHLATGTYVISLSLSNPGGGSKTLTAGSVTVTVNDGGSANVCRFATANISGNTVTVHIHDLNCDPQDEPFYFKVCGR